MKRTVGFWALAVVMMLLLAVWQRLSGPTHPLRFDEQIADFQVSGSLLRTHSTSAPMPVAINVNAGGEPVSGTLVWRRYPSGESWTRVDLVLTEGELRAEIPAQPSAGKVEYRIELQHVGTTTLLPAEEPVVARYKDDVPLGFLLPHILCMMLVLLWASRAGLEATVAGPGLKRQALVTLGLLVVGGLVFGPIVQKYAFGAYWTGWPLGQDLTDNKVAIAALAWLNAVVQLRTRRGGRWAVLVAAVVTLVIFAIPHSLRGSTLDYDSGQTLTG
ncbi:MAG: hypothetical protein ABIF77_07785 [bacterium]